MEVTDEVFDRGSYGLAFAQVDERGPERAQALACNTNHLLEESGAVSLDMHGDGRAAC